MATGCVDSIFKAQCAIIMMSLKLTTTPFLSTLQNLHFGEHSTFVYRFGLKTRQTLYQQNI